MPMMNGAHETLFMCLSRSKIFWWLFPQDWRKKISDQNGVVTPYMYVKYRNNGEISPHRYVICFQSYATLILQTEWVCFGWIFSTWSFAKNYGFIQPPPATHRGQPVITTSCLVRMNGSCNFSSVWHLFCQWSPKAWLRFGNLQS
jgi:hypothetical protein